MSLDEFLEYISQIESNKGKNIAHKTMRHGPHAGDAAFGKYGIMPNTAKEFYNRRKAEGLTTPDEDEIPNMNGKQLGLKFFVNPELEKTYAEAVGKRVLERGGSPEKAAYMYTMGHNLDPNKISDKNLNKSDYVNKFKRLHQIYLDKQPSLQQLQQPTIIDPTTLNE